MSSVGLLRVRSCGLVLATEFRRPRRREEELAPRARFELATLRLTAEAAKL
jgi:hypothetical protein